MAPNYETVINESRRYANDARRELPIQKAYLFGSYAKKSADERSDVDICFFLDDYGGKNRIELIAQLLKIGREYKIYIEPLVFELSDIDADNPFVNEVLRTGIEI